MTMSTLLTLVGLVAAGGGPPGADPGEVIRDRYEGPHGARAYRLFLPSGEGAERVDGGRAPLLVMLHGCTQDPDDLALGTRMDAAAAARGVAVLYPEQDPAAHPLRCWNWYEPDHQGRDGGEPALLAGMIREVAARHGLRVGSGMDGVVVAGMSAGGAMATILGVTYPDLVRGVASHSGVAFGVAQGLSQATAALAGTLDPDRDGLTQGALSALPTNTSGTEAGREGLGRGETPLLPRLLVIHGEADEIVAPVNSRWFFQQWMGLLEARTGSRPDLRVSTPVGLEAWGAHREDLLAQAGGGATEPEVGSVAPDARFVRIRELGHAWSGGDDAGSYTEPRGPDASRWILDFFFPSPGGGEGDVSHGGAGGDHGSAGGDEAGGVGPHGGASAPDRFP